MNTPLDYIVSKVKGADFAFCRYITINDTGKNGSHQAGFLIPKAAGEAIFGNQLVRGENLKLQVRISWMDDFETQSVFTYYGRKKNEIRLTNFGRNFPFFQEDNVGDLLVLAKVERDEYCGAVLSHEEDIESFQVQFGLSVGRSNQLIVAGAPLGDAEEKLYNAIHQRVALLNDFPDTLQMALWARELHLAAHHLAPAQVLAHCDKVLLDWIGVEYRLFQAIEEKIYATTYTQPFASCQQLIDFANSILNRRKSRAGKSLEHHLACLFTTAQLRFEAQPVTENNKKPDFIFPDGRAYHNLEFPDNQLVFLGAKTTCKDRWRQVLNEADRIKVKYLFTLQPGVSKNQLREMRDEQLHLVIPKQHFNYFDPELHQDLISLSSFIDMVRETQNITL